jgi:hypothetical protein
MFKGKIYLYKNINWKEEKVEKDFDNQDEFNKYIEKNPELKKLEKDFEKIEFPKSFEEMRNFLDDFDKKFFWDIEKKKWFFDEVSTDFEKLFKKSQKLLGK